MLELERTADPAPPIPHPCEAKESARPAGRVVARAGQTLVAGLLLPALVYLGGFTLLTWPLMRRFSEGFFCDAGDGLQNAWNLWWFTHSVLDKHQSPFFTDMLHVPSGVTLLGHTLMPFNGILAAGLTRVLTLVQAYNAIVVFTFVASGVTAFWLVREFVKSYGAALLGGGVFAFSAYRFAHAEGHMNLLSMEFLPLAALFAYRWVTGPTAGRAVLLAGAVFLNLLCDYHYFAYSVLLAGIMAGWKLRQERSWGWFFAPGRRASVVVLAAVFLATSGVMIGALLWSHARDRLEGLYELGVFSMDALAPVIPGGHWRFAGWTAWFWERLPGNIHESSVHVGVGVLILCGAAAWGVRGLQRGTPAKQQVFLWAAVWWIGTVLALGPWLRVFGQKAGVPMPYMLLLVVPIMRVPVRFMAVTSVASAVLAGIGWQHLAARRTPRRAVAMVLLLGLMVVEALPAALPLTLPAAPAYVHALREEAGGGAVLDDVSHASPALYYQTVHGKPLAFGYISRVPRSVSGQDAAIAGALQARDFAGLRERFGIEYVVLQERVNDPGVEVVFADGEAVVHRIRR